jgi:hypothetical protein
VIWTKTDAGRIEIQVRNVVKERPQRNLLLVIDGIKTEEMLLAHLAGISAKDFVDLHALGLIAPMVSSGRGTASQPGRLAGAPNPTTTPEQQAPAAPEAPLDYAQFTATLKQMISKELGLRGFVLTLAVEKAGTAEELQAVAHRTIDQIRDRKGDAAAAAAQRALHGG